MDCSFRISLYPQRSFAGRECLQTSINSSVGRNSEAPNLGCVYCLLQRSPTSRGPATLSGAPSHSISSRRVASRQCLAVLPYLPGAAKLCADTAYTYSTLEKHNSFLSIAVEQVKILKFDKISLSTKFSSQLHDLSL